MNTEDTIEAKLAINNDDDFDMIRTTTTTMVILPTTSTSDKGCHQNNTNMCRENTTAKLNVEIETSVKLLTKE